MKYLDAEEAVSILARGGMIIVTDDKERENEGDIVFPAALADAGKVDFLSRHARGLTCVALSRDMADHLNLMPMGGSNTSRHETAFTMSVDADNGGTGISIRDRLDTIRILGNTESRPDELARPGHMFPLIAHPGGLAARQGHTEAAVALSRMAGCSPAAVICEILGNGYDMSRGRELEEFALTHGLGILRMEDLLLYDLEPQAETRLHTEYGDFDMMVYPPEFPGREPTVVLSNRIGTSDAPPLIRLHSECLTGDLLGSLHCDCGGQLKKSLEMIGREGGMLVYMRQEGRGIGLAEKIRAYRLQSEGLDTWDANTALGHKPDERSYRQACRILKSLGISSCRLLTNNPEKTGALQESGIEVVPLSLDVGAGPFSRSYMETKRDRFFHTVLQNETEKREEISI